MSATTQPSRMTRHRPTDAAAEAQRYLAVVALFRAEGREPRWQPEPGASPRRRVATALRGAPRRNAPGRAVTWKRHAARPFDGREHEGGRNVDFLSPPIRRARYGDRGSLLHSRGCPGGKRRRGPAADVPAGDAPRSG